MNKCIFVAFFLLILSEGAQYDWVKMASFHFIWTLRLQSFVYRVIQCGECNSNISTVSFQTLTFFLFKLPTLTVCLNVVHGATMECLHKHPFVFLNAERYGLPHPPPVPTGQNATCSSLTTTQPSALYRTYSSYSRVCYCILTYRLLMVNNLPLCPTITIQRQTNVISMCF